MLLRSPSGGVVDASGDEVKRLQGCGFVPVEPKTPPKKPAPRKRKTASK